MARAKKIGVDYYSHDVGAQKKQTVKALRSRFGNDGYAFWFILLELLGERDGLYMDCSDEATWIYLCTEVMIDEDKVTGMLNFLGRLGAIDKDLWAVDKIIWCQNFTDRLADVFKKRGVPKPEKPISKMVSATKTNISATEMGVSATEMRQSKVKESKVKNSKVNTTLEVDTTPVDNSDDGSVDGLDFDNNLIPKQEAGVSVMSVAEEVDCFWDVFKTVYPRKRGISVPMAKDALRKFLEYGGDQADLIAAAVKYGRTVAESKTEEQFMKTPHVFAGGYFKTFVPKYRRNCPTCHGEGFVEGPDGNMVECCCVDRYKEWKA